MLEKVVKVYKYEELAPEVQAKLIERYRNDGGEPFATQDVSEYFKERLTELGYIDATVSWSLGYCQGDGMAFECHMCCSDLKTLRDRLFPAGHKVRRVLRGQVLDCISVDVKHEGHYYHWNSMRVEVDNTDYNHETPAQEECLVMLREAIAEDCKDTSRMLEKKGYEILEGYDSDEYIAESFSNSDTLYLVDGTYYHESWESDSQPPLPFEAAA